MRSLRASITDVRLEQDEPHAAAALPATGARGLEQFEVPDARQRRVAERLVQGASRRVPDISAGANGRDVHAVVAHELDGVLHQPPGDPAAAGTRGRHRRCRPRPSAHGRRREQPTRTRRAYRRRRRRTHTCPRSCNSERTARGLGRAPIRVMEPVEDRAHRGRHAARRTPAPTRAARTRPPPRDRLVRTAKYNRRCHRPTVSLRVRPRRCRPSRPFNSTSRLSRNETLAPSPTSSRTTLETRISPPSAWPATRAA